MNPIPDPGQLRAELVHRALPEFERPLIGYATSITHDHDAARDIVQDTFLKLWIHEDPASLDGPGLKPWLYTVCRNRSLDWLRRRHRLVSLDSDSFAQFAASTPEPADAVSSRDDAADVLRYFQRLPANQAECLRLKFQHDLSYKEIAAATGLTVTNVGFLIHTGLKRLRQLLTPPASRATAASPLLPLPT